MTRILDRAGKERFQKAIMGVGMSLEFTLYGASPNTDKQSYDPMYPSKIWSSQNPNVYYFNDDCAFDPHAVVYDACLWEAADIPGFIRDLSAPY